MSFRREIRVSKLADRQIDEADDWWRRNREKAPEAIVEELDRVGRLLALQPYIGKRATNVTLPGVRRIHIERIHHDVYYRIECHARRPSRLVQRETGGVTPLTA